MVVFSWLDYDKSGFITLEEIDRRAYEAMMRGDDELGLDIPQKKKDLSHMTFDERQRNTGSDVRRQAMGRKERRRVERINQIRRELNVGPADLNGFQHALIRKYGNIMRAWKE